MGDPDYSMAPLWRLWRLYGALPEAVLIFLKSQFGKLCFGTRLPHLTYSAAPLFDQPHIVKYPADRFIAKDRRMGFIQFDTDPFDMFRSTTDYSLLTAS